jgi:glycine oxidase
MRLWPAWLHDLQRDSGRSVYFRREGTLVVAHAADLDELAHFEQVLRHRLSPEDARGVRPLQAAALAIAEPALSGRFAQGLMLEGEGQLANDELLLALEEALSSPLVTWHEGTPVTALVRSRVCCATGEHPADVVVDTRGVGARADCDGLRGVRGEVLTVACEAVRLRRPVRLLHPRHSLYVAPRPQGRFVVGATELESQDDGPMALRSMLELGSTLFSLHPGFAEARVLRLAAALRPAFDDHRPALREHAGVWQLNGLYRHGYLCAPALVERLVDELTR